MHCSSNLIQNDNQIIEPQQVKQPQKPNHFSCLSQAQIVQQTSTTKSIKHKSFVEDLEEKQRSKSASITGREQ